MNNARNYHAHGGSEWVVGGKLTFLPGAKVEGAEGVLPTGGAQAALDVAESEATTVAALREDYNQLMDIVKECQHVAVRAGAESVSAYVKVVYRPEGEILTIDKKIKKHAEA